MCHQLRAWVLFKNHRRMEQSNKFEYYIILMGTAAGEKDFLRPTTLLSVHYTTTFSLRCENVSWALLKMLSLQNDYQTRSTDRNLFCLR